MPAARPSLPHTIGAHTRWAREPDRSAATAPAREAFERRFLDEVDPDRVLSEDERNKRAASARKAYFARLSLAGLQARSKRQQRPA